MPDGHKREQLVEPTPPISQPGHSEWSSLTGLPTLCQLRCSRLLRVNMRTSWLNQAESPSQGGRSAPPRSSRPSFRSARPSLLHSSSGVRPSSASPSRRNGRIDLDQSTDQSTHLAKLPPCRTRATRPAFLPMDGSSSCTMRFVLLFFHFCGRSCTFTAQIVVPIPEVTVMNSKLFWLNLAYETLLGIFVPETSHYQNLHEFATYVRIQVTS